MNSSVIAENLALTLKDPQQPRYEGGRLPLTAINVLPQPRKTFENLRELGLDIAQKGILNPLIVAALKLSDARIYLEVINKLWRTNFRIENLTSTTDNNQETYFILIAGERRFRSCRILWQEGCLACREEHGAEEPGVCVQRHFRSETIETRVCRDIAPLSALFLQLSENTHMSVPAYEEAEAYYLLYRLIHESRNRFSIASFARQVGRNPRTIKNALRFCELPDFIRDEVKKGNLTYGLAVEIARLKETGAENQELEWWTLRAMTDGQRMRVADFHRMIAQHLEDKNSPQMTLSDIFEEKDRKTLQILHIRRTVEREMIAAIWGWIHYFQRLNALLREGLIGKPESPFSARSPLRITRALAKEFESAIIHLNGIMPEEIRAQANPITQELVEQLDRLLSSEDDNDSAHQ